MEKQDGTGAIYLNAKLYSVCLLCHKHWCSSAGCESPKCECPCYFETDMFYDRRILYTVCGTCRAQVRDMVNRLGQWTPKVEKPRLRLEAPRANVK